LDNSDLVFADPDNGIVDDDAYRRKQKTFGKQMPLSEILAIAEERSAVIYHHNTRFKGGHDKEGAYPINCVSGHIVTSELLGESHGYQTGNYR